MLDDKNESYKSLDNELRSILGMDNMERERQREGTTQSTYLCGISRNSHPCLAQHFFESDLSCLCWSMCYSMSSAWEFLVTTQFLDLAILCMRCCCCWGVGHTDPRYAIFLNFTPFAALTERDRESGKEGEWEKRAQWPRAVTASAAASTVAAAAVLPPFLLLLRFILRYLVFGLNDFGQRVRKK